MMIISTNLLEFYSFCLLCFALKISSIYTEHISEFDRENAPRVIVNPNLYASILNFER